MLIFVVRRELRRQLLVLLYKLKRGKKGKGFRHSASDEVCDADWSFSQLQPDIKKRDVKEVLISLSESEEEANRSNSRYIQVLLLRFTP